MIDLAELAKKYQTEGERNAYMETVTSPCTFAPERVATAAHLLTIASHLREAAGREAKARDLLDAGYQEICRQMGEPQHFGESMVETIRKNNAAIKSHLDRLLADSQPQEQETPREGQKITIEATIEERFKDNDAVRLAIGPVHIWLTNEALNAARVKDAEREAEPPLSPPKGSRAPAPARLRDELAAIAMAGLVNPEGTVDRILDALADPTIIQREARYFAGEWSRRNIEAFIADVKEGRL